MPRVSFGRDTLVDPMGPAAPMRARLVSLLLRPTAPPLALGVVVAASLIAAETLLVYLLKQVAPHSVFGVLYVIGVLVVSTGWGFGMAATTSVASALALNYFRVQPDQGIIPTEPEDAVAIIIFLAVAVLG
jgi:K+-sensing histidine kinase KdpD